VYDKLTEYNWPGNVRQLENAMIYAVYMAQNGLIKIDNLPDDLKNNYPITSEHNKKKFLSLNEIEKKAIEDVMIYTENDKNEAVRILGISKSTLYRKLKKYGFED
jgi:transcriptional regulator with PAS, ATPase and Fis domain